MITYALFRRYFLAESYETYLEDLLLKEKL
jgi:hypothetical protein